MNRISLLLSAAGLALLAPMAQLRGAETAPAPANQAACTKPASRLGLLTGASPAVTTEPAAHTAAPSPVAPRPNIVFIYGDDVGYGDIGCYGATKVKTPHLDQLATQGLRFTDAHSSAGTCTPSRYSVMTGEYAWRKTGTNILPGDAGLIIEPGRLTLPSMLAQAGYATACIGKWHLGLGRGKPDWNGDITPGPMEVGFGSDFILPATADGVPCVFVRDHRIVGLDPKDPITVSYEGPLDDAPLGRDHPELLKMKFSHGHDQTIVNGISRIGYMKGGKAALWVDEDIASTLTQEATNFIEQHKDAPFFLYFATSDIHVPHAPGSRFAGKSECGIRGDTIEQLDGCAGEILATLDRLKLAENTLVIFSSDNGPVVDDGYADGSVVNLHGHKPAGPLRGGKYTNWEGGTRMPLIVRWPGKVTPGVSSALLCQVDFIASLAALLGQDLPTEAAPDSCNELPALLGQSPTGRDHLVEQGGPLALREGSWKLIPSGAGAGDAAPPKGRAPREVKLFNLEDDLGETTNVAVEQPEQVKKMTTLLQQVRTSGRDRP